MIIFRYLAKEVLLTLVVLTSILVLIFMSNQVVIYLNRAANGAIPGMLVLKLMVLELPNLLGLLLPLGFYFALLMAYGRLYADSELIALQACGYGQAQLLKHTFILALGVALVTAQMISMSPSIAYKRAELLQTSGIQTLIQTVIPGRFREIMGGQYVFYVESVNTQHTQAKHIFVAKRVLQDQHPAWDILTAEAASLHQDAGSGEVYVTLNQGRHYRGQAGHADYTLDSFDSYAARLPHVDKTVHNDIRTMPFHALLPFNNPDKIKAAELQWRLSIPLMVLCLTVVGIPLSRVNPRSGKYARLFPAVILAVVYANGMFVARDWIATGKLSPKVGVWWLHVGIVFLGVGLMYWQRKKPV